MSVTYTEENPLYLEGGVEVYVDQENELRVGGIYGDEVYLNLYCLWILYKHLPKILSQMEIGPESVTVSKVGDLTKISLAACGQSLALTPEQLQTLKTQL